MTLQTLPESVGQLSDCPHIRRVASARGSVFVLCRRAAQDLTYRRYPNLPVSDCPGYEPCPVDEED